MSEKRLAEYRRKRDFGRTKEPSGARARRKAAPPIFVIQEHHARRLHYDFRLEAEGVLKSWAVPREPSLDPAKRRLAVRTEDHPLEYARFHGRIPAGEYGAGEVKLWDRGTYRNLMAEKRHPLSMEEAIEGGHLEVFLKGKRLQGRFALIRTSVLNAGRDTKENWILVKMRDVYARREPSDRALDEQARAEPASLNRKSSRKVA